MHVPQKRPGLCAPAWPQHLNWFWPQRRPVHVSQKNSVVLTQIRSGGLLPEHLYVCVLPSLLSNCLWPAWHTVQVDIVWKLLVCGLLTHLSATDIHTVKASTAEAHQNKPVVYGVWASVVRAWVSTLTVSSNCCVRSIVCYRQTVYASMKSCNWACGCDRCTNTQTQNLKVGLAGHAACNQLEKQLCVSFQPG